MSTTIYLVNKYTKTYFRIIDRAKLRPKPSEYTEKHHIIPKCSGGKEIVVLTFKEHWVVHHLLLKMVTGELKAKMYYAFNRMGHVNPKQQGKRVINSQMFCRIKMANKDACSGKNNPRFGTKYSEETKRKMSDNHLDFSGRKHPNFGKRYKRSEETKKKMSQNHANVSGENNPNFGKRYKRSEETKKKMSLSARKRKGSIRTIQDTAPEIVLIDPLNLRY